jgi:pilus assembly protein CpaE
MRPQANPDDDFEAGFEAADDFGFSAEGAWAEKALADVEAGAPQAVPAARDPFADLSAASQARRSAEPAREAPMAPADDDGPRAAEAASGGAAAAGVPRIAIHVFCEKPQTAAVADQASKDRRMARATTTVLPGGLSAAVQYYQNQPTPPLVIVESSDQGEGLMGLLDQLADVCDPGTKVVVIGAANDIALYRELMKRGVSEYLVPPLQPLQMISAVTGLYADPSSPFVGRQIAFVGAKGGVGASTVAHNFAYALSENVQANTVIVDYDLPFGTAGLDFNQDPIQGVANALNQPDRLDPVLLERMMARCTDRLSLFAAPATLDDDYEIGAETFEDVTTKIRGTAPFVVLDLPHLWSSWIRRTLLSSDDVVIVATPDLASLRNAKNMIDLLKQARPNDAPPRLVLNQVGVPGRPEIPLKDFTAALGVQPALVLPFEPKLFGKAANNGQMVMETGIKSKAVEGFAHLAQLISKREAASAPAKRQASLSSLFKRK